MDHRTNDCDSESRGLLQPRAKSRGFCSWLGLINVSVCSWWFGTLEVICAFQQSGCTHFSMKKQRSLDKGQQCICATYPETALCDISLRWWWNPNSMLKDVWVSWNKMAIKHREKWLFLGFRASSNDEEESTLFIRCTKTNYYSSSSGGCIVSTPCVFCSYQGL